MSDDANAQAMREAIGHFIDEVERSDAARAARGLGGQQCGPSSADFAYVQPSVAVRLRWWARRLGDAAGRKL